MRNTLSCSAEKETIQQHAILSCQIQLVTAQLISMWREKMQYVTTQCHRTAKRTALLCTMQYMYCMLIHSKLQAMMHAFIAEGSNDTIKSMLCVYIMHTIYYLLSLTVYFSHIDNALHAQQCTHSSSSYTVLACSCLCYDTLLTNALLDVVVAVYSTAWDQSHMQWHKSVKNSIGGDRSRAYHKNSRYRNDQRARKDVAAA
jgi:hypothetical protein